MRGWLVVAVSLVVLLAPVMAGAESICRTNGVTPAFSTSDLLLDYISALHVKTAEKAPLIVKTAVASGSIINHLLL